MSYYMTAQWREQNIPAICAFMRNPDIYWSMYDRLSPQPEERDFESWLLHPDVATYVAAWEDMVIGFVQFARRTSVLVEMTVAYAKHWRGLPAKTLTLYAMADLLKERGILKIYSNISTDNRPAIYAARAIGMKQEGRLTKAIVREGGVRDLLIFGITREEFLKRGGVD